VAVIGLGAGIGTVAYVGGKLSKNYDSGYAESVQAGEEALAALNIEIVDKTDDGSQATLTARRADGTPVAMSIARREETLTEVGVRTGRLGLWDYDVSQQIHEQISARLRALSAVESRPPPGGMAEKALEAMPQSAAGDSDAGSGKTVHKAGAATTQRTASVRETIRYQPDVTGDRIVLFESDSNDLSAAGRERLDHVAAELNSHQHASVTLHGYSDASGTAGYNFLLSVRRAESAKAYLVSRGVDPDQVMVIGHGALDFLADNESEAGRRMNRRVEIEVHGLQ
jgi:outer membrane protein OmpA-like peptidoglycan-associated protein